MTEQERLLNKYYSGETSLEEEKELKSLFIEDNKQSPEQDIFGYFESMANAPDKLEDNILSALENQQKQNKAVHMRVLSIASAAAVLLILLSIFIDNKSKKTTQMENDFFVMEQALFQISESLQPNEQEEMFVLWVDDDLEIIIN
jgi:hypothetical protein